MMLNLGLKKRLCYSIAACLSLFAVCNHHLYATNNSIEKLPDHRQVNITYNAGVLDVTGFPQTQPVEENATITWSGLGIKASNFVFLGWQTCFTPIITSIAAEKAFTSMPTFYPVGDSLAITEDMTLYAVWAADYNNDGFPDYNGHIIRPYSINKEVSARSEMLTQDTDISLQSGIPVQEDDNISLRTDESLPSWNNHYDEPAYDDRVYYVGCSYNVDPANTLIESHITLDDRYSFAGTNPSIISSVNDLNLVIEYGGVLIDSCMIGGKEQKPLKIIKMPTGTTVKELLDPYPFMFNAIKKDGEAILKMYFIKDNGSENHPDAGDWHINMITPPWGPPARGGFPKPFQDPKTGAYTDTLTIKFKIYNKPVFESGIISQYIDPRGNIRLNHVSGTPLKYMMRSINKISWRPADSPLSTMEQLAVDNGTSIHLREMDMTIGYQMFQKSYFFTDAFDWDKNITEFSTIFYPECQAAYYQSSYDNLSPADQAIIMNGVTPSFWGYNYWKATYAPFLPPETLHKVALESSFIFNGSYLSTPLSGATATAEIQAIAERDWDLIYRQRRADAIFVPEPCREVTELKFETILTPDVQRYVEINTLPGVTAAPVAGIKHYVKAHQDFTFTLAFAGGEPLKVTATGYYSKITEELTGADLGDGTFRYIIRQVSEPWTINISSEPASAVVDNESIAGGRVWTYANTLFIRSEKAARANIYALSGSLLKQVNVSAGTTTEKLERGLYVVEIDGARYKVVVK